MRVRNVQLLPAISNELNQTIAHHNAKFPIRRVQVIYYEDYKGGYCFWGYDLTPDQAADQSHLHPIKTGNLRLELQFATSLDKTINVLVYAEFDNLIEINGLREVTTDY